mgnify:CR=1 FL=1
MTKSLGCAAVFVVVMMAFAFLISPCFADDDSLISRDIEASKKDYRNFYANGENLLRLGIGIGAAGIFAAINAKLTYKQTVWLGLSYRTQDAVAINLGIRKDRFIFGYSYDYSLTDIQKYSVGSHELLFIVKFNRSKPKL